MEKDFQSKEVEINETEVSQLIRGERPEGMPFNVFKLKRAAVQHYLKKYRKGQMFYENNGVPYENVQG